jgi:hypothetical protein
VMQGASCVNSIKFPYLEASNGGKFCKCEE